MLYNSDQKRFLTLDNNALLVLGNAGTGKKTLVARKILKALEEGTPPHKIAFFSFSKSSQNLLSEIIRRTISVNYELIKGSTFHTFALKILKKEFARLGLRPGYSLIDNNDVRDILYHLWDQFSIEDYSFDIFFDEFSKYKSNRLYKRSIDLGLEPFENIFNEYEKYIKHNNMFDFLDLNFLAFDVCVKNNFKIPDYFEFDLIFLCEFEDFQLEEYLVIKSLLSEKGSFVLIGDVDQSIYQWRKAQTRDIIKSFQKEFKPIKKISFSINYRSSQKLLTASRKLLFRNKYRQTKKLKNPFRKKGELIYYFEELSEQIEIEKIEKTIKNLKEQNFVDDYSDIAVLTRSHYLAKKCSELFSIPHIRKEMQNSFWSNNIKYIQSYLRMLLMPTNEAHLNKWCQSSYASFDHSEYLNGYTAMSLCGARWTDFLIWDIEKIKDPLFYIYDCFKSQEIIFLDVETTGLSHLDDDIIEIAAVKFNNGSFKSKFHILIHSKKDIGDSFFTHGLCKDDLKQKGVDLKEAITLFNDYLGDSQIIGHNINFDKNFLELAFKEVGIDKELNILCDSMDLAQRFENCSSYSLANLAQHLDLINKPLHRAEFDVMTLVELFETLIPRVLENHEKRSIIYKNYSSTIKGFRKDFLFFRELLESQNGDLSSFLTLIMERLGALGENDCDEDKQLLEFSHQFKSEYQCHLSLKENLNSFLESCLNINSIKSNKLKGNVYIGNIHKAKGLEFDVVFIPGMNMWEFPTSDACRSKEYDEERKILFTAMTRARKRLYLSRSQNKKLNKETIATKPSIFLKEMRSRFNQFK